VAQARGYDFDQNAKQGRHQHLIAYLVNAFPEHEDAREAVRELARLRDLRVRADYRLNRPIQFEDATDATSRAREVAACLSDAAA